MMKIIYIDHTPFEGGAQLVLASHIRSLNKKEFQPVVICSFDTPSLIEIYKKAGALVLPIKFEKLKILSPISLFRFFRTRSELGTILVSEKPDLVVTNTVRAHIVASLLCKKLGIPLIWIIRDYTFNQPFFSLLKHIPTRIFTVSKELVHYYHLGSSSKVEVIYVGAEFNAQKEVSQSSVQTLKKEWKVDKETAIVGFVGRLVGWKGPQVLLGALPEVLNEFPHTVAVFAGKGAGQDDNNEDNLSAMVRSLGLENHVSMLGFVPMEMIPTLFKALDIFVHTSIEPEPFATVVVQAMSASIPVIGTRLGGTPEIIIDHDNGLLVEPDDPHLLAQAIITLLKDPRLASRVGKRGHSTVIPSFTEECITKKMESIFKEEAL